MRSDHLAATRHRRAPGSKKVSLFRPHNNGDLYEGHMREAILDYSTRTGVRGTPRTHAVCAAQAVGDECAWRGAQRFRRKRLMESTSMVNSPVDIAAFEARVQANASDHMRLQFPRCVAASCAVCFRTSRGSALITPAMRQPVGQVCNGCAPAPHRM